MFWNPVPLEATQHGANKYFHVWEAWYTSIDGFTPTSVYTQLSGHTQIWGHAPISEVHPDIMVLPINIGVYTGTWLYTDIWVHLHIGVNHDIGYTPILCVCVSVSVHTPMSEYTPTSECTQIWGCIPRYRSIPKVGVYSFEPLIDDRWEPREYQRRMQLNTCCPYAPLVSMIWSSTNIFSTYTTSPRCVGQCVRVPQNVGMHPHIAGTAVLDPL